MSREWTACPEKNGTKCGRCGNPIRFGHPMQQITPHPSRGLRAREKHPFLRCRLCADGTPPDDLPPAKSAQTAIRPTGQPSLPLQPGGDR
jgi:hypothetical protein